MKSIVHINQHTLWVFVVVFIVANLGISHYSTSQCNPSDIDLCEIGNNNIIQASFHAQIAKTSNGYSITGEDFAPSGTDYSTVLTNIPSLKYPMPANVTPVWGAMGGRTQAVFIATDNNIYAVGEEDLIIDKSKTNGPAWGVTSLKLPIGITVCDVNKWQGAAGSGSDNNSNTSGQKDGFLVFSTYSGEAYITGDGASAIQSGSSNSEWTLLDMPEGVSVVNFGVGYRTLLILGSDGNLYTAGPDSYLGDGGRMSLTTLTILSIQPNISIFGITQIEAGYNSYFVLDGDGTVHVLGENSEGALGIGNEIDLKTWSKVGQDCPNGVLNNVAFISTMSTHDNRISSSAIIVDGTIRSWGSNNKQSITSGIDMIISCPITPTGNNKNAVAISNGGHISPYVNTSVQICNIGHNRQGAFGDGNDEEGDYGEYQCRTIPGMPEICGTKEANLSLDKSVNDMSPNTGQDIVFTITVTNNGPEASTGSFVRDLLDPAFYYIGDDSNGDYNNTTGLWIVGPLDVGESLSIKITVKVLKPGIHANYAQILVDNEVDINSTPGDSSSNQDDDDSVVINASPCPITESEILLCPDDSLSIANEWIYESGLYVETIPTGSGCDSLHISTVIFTEEAPIPELNIDCKAMKYSLSIDPTSSWIPTWDNGSTTYQTTYDSSSNQAFLTLENSPNCIEQSSLMFPGLFDISNIPSFPDTTILENTLLQVDLGLDPQEWQINWTPEIAFDCTSCMVGNIVANQSAVVTAYLEHISGCTYESSFFLTIEKAPENIYTSNIFSPNGDSNNDEWTLFNTSNITIEECNIYDRWGNLMYKSIGTIPKWNGTANGKDCEQGVYVYMIIYKDSDGNNQVYSGNLTLIR